MRGSVAVNGLRSGIGSWSSVMKVVQTEQTTTIEKERLLKPNKKRAHYPKPAFGYDKELVRVRAGIRQALGQLAR